MYSLASDESFVIDALLDTYVQSRKKANVLVTIQEVMLPDLQNYFACKDSQAVAPRSVPIVNLAISAHKVTCRVNHTDWERFRLA
jgi:hypothetical protein